MPVFDEFDSLLDQVQTDTFGQTIILDGVADPVPAINDTIPVYFGEQQTLVNVWQVSTRLLPPQFSRGHLVIVDGVEYRVGTIHPKDGMNTPFELEKR